MAQIPIHPGLFTWPAERPQLLGSRCNHCGQVAFPAQDSCRACSRRDTQIIPLGDRGTLWTWTIQSFMPKPPYNSGESAETFRPYGVGYVEMPGGVRVEARLRENQPGQLRIGMDMQLVIEKFRTDDSGNELMQFTFRVAD
jgi:uncharacterized protein